MSSNRQLSVIVLLLIASIIGIVILFVRNAMVTPCNQSDKQICSFLGNYKNMGRQPMEGVYTVTNQNDESIYTVSWIKDKESRSISAMQEEEAILDAVILKEYLYLKDYSDNKWWKQNISDAPENQSYLPFDPYQYFAELDPVLFDWQTTYTRIGEIICGSNKCIRYQVGSAKQSEDLQRFIYINSDNFQLYGIVDANSSSAHEVTLTASEKSIYEPKETKIPPKDKNIFLDYLVRREREREKQLEYLKEFQSQREKAEELQSDLPKYVEESATASAN